MDKLKELQAAYQACVSKMEAILAAADDSMTDEQQQTFDAAKAEAEKLKLQISNYEALLTEQAAAQAMASAPAPSIGRQTQPDGVILDDPAKGPVAKNPITIPAQAKRWAGNLHSFKGPDADVLAYKCGMWLCATILGNAFAANFCRQHGISTNKVALEPDQIQSLHQEGVNTQGGFLVFDEMENTIIRLVESYGLARQKMRTVPMISDVKNQPRRTGGLTAYFVGEGKQITESTGSWDNVKLITKKLAAISVASNELISDAVISLVDEIIREIALAFATKEDVCAFQGDGTSTYGGIVGLVQKLSTLNGVDDGGGLVLSANNTYAEITDAELVKMIGAVPNYPGLQPEWYCSKPFWAQVMIRLIRATGGATMAEMEGIRRMIYAGYPVNWTSGTTAMPVTVANSQIACLFGDLRMSSMFGDRSGIVIATSPDATVGSTNMFDTDSFAIRGVERFDINVHDVGSASAAGPVVGLIMAAS